MSALDGSAMVTSSPSSAMPSRIDVSGVPAVPAGAEATGNAASTQSSRRSGRPCAAHGASLQAAKAVVENLLRAVVRRGAVQTREQVRPHGVQHRLHRLGAGGHGDHRVLLGQDDAELPEGAIAAVAVPGHPELEAVALAPVGVVLLVRGVDLPGRRLRDVALRQQLDVVPAAALQVQLAELGDVLGAGEQAAEALLPAGRPGQPADLADAERVEQPRPQVLGSAACRRPAGCTLAMV